MSSGKNMISILSPVTLVQDDAVTKVVLEHAVIEMVNDNAVVLNNAVTEVV